MLKFGALGKAHVDGGDADGLEERAPLWIPRGTHLGGDEAVAERHESLGEDVGYLVFGRDQDAVELDKGPGAGKEVGGEDALRGEHAAGDILAAEGGGVRLGRGRVHPSLQQPLLLLWAGWGGPGVEVLEGSRNGGCVGGDHGGLGKTLPYETVRR